MFLLDAATYNVRKNNIHPFEKFFYMLSMLAVSLSSKNLIVFIIIFFLSILLTLYITKIKLVGMIKLLLLPMLFIITSIIPVVFSFGRYAANSIFSISLSGFYMYVSKESLMMGAVLFSRVVASVSVFYFFVLSTPIIELEYILTKLKLPGIFIEIFILMYRFIFVFMGITSGIILSQNSRMGYRNYKTSFNSFYLLASSSFIKSYIFMKNSYNALLSRGYNGQLNILHKNYSFSFFNIASLITVNAALVFIINFKIFIRWI